MDIGKAFTFVFEDEDWIVKILIAAGILLAGILFSWLIAIPLILAMALLGGYMVAVIRRVLNGQVDGLPQWENWGDLLIDGLKVWVIGLVYALPLIIASFCLLVPAMALGDDAGAVMSILIMLASCLIILYSIVVTIVIPAAFAFWVASDDLGAAFRFGDILAFVRENLSTYLVTFIMTWVASLIGGLGSVVCGLGMLVTLPYAYVVTGHLYGQAYMASSQQAAQPALDENWS